MKQPKDTSWESAEPWYNRSVGEKGHYYHQSIILPSSLEMLQISAKSTGSFLDLGCGQGVFARHLPPGIDYVGLDSSSSLIKDAKKQTREKNRLFILADVTKKPLPLEKTDFDYGAFILSLQNMEDGKGALANAGLHLKKGGLLLLVLNHPCFRIPRQSSWEIDPKANLQYRRMNSYMSSLKIPIQTHPGKKGDSSTTFSFHHPLSQYMSWLSSAGFVIQAMQEWCSDKTSEGGRARIENRARKEFPLFLALLCQKK